MQTAPLPWRSRRNKHFYWQLKAEGCCTWCRRKLSKARLGKTFCAWCAKKHLAQNRANHNPDKSKARRNAQRKEAIIALGGKCASPTCKWLNEDGSFGCTVYDALQIDHVNGGGGKELDLLNKNYAAFLRKVMREINTGNYQVLCANCNWIKRHQCGENKRVGNWKYQRELRALRAAQEAA